MKVRVAAVVLLLASIALAQAAPSTTPKSPKEVVEAYCKLDFDGALTSSEGWPTISPLFVWPDAPGWDTFTVVRSYKVGAAKETGNTATVPVTYILAGILDSTPRFRPAKATTVVVVFHLVYSNKHHVLDADGNPDHEEASGPMVWKIDKPQDEPHVSVERATAMTSDWLANASDTVTKNNAQIAAQELQKAK